MMKKLLVIIFLAVVLAIIDSRYVFVGSWLTLLPWGLVGLASGIYAQSRKEALINGAIYGFILSFIFMVSGYSGTAPLITRFPFFALLGLFGALCGLILGILGFTVFHKKKK